MAGDARDGGRGSGAAKCELTFTTKALIPETVELIRSLGISVHVSESDAVLNGRVVGRRWRMTFQSPFNPFTVPRKGDRWVPLRTRRSQYRYVSDVRRAEPSPMRCIQVDSPDNTYLASRRMVPTHNTTVLRMLAVTIAAGLHPFTMARTEPRRVLLVDCENPQSQTRRKLRPMVNQATVMGVPLEHGQLRVKVREAMDLANQADVAWLVERVTAHEPDVLVIGPLYQLHAGNPNDEQSAREVGKALEAAQSVSGCAIIVEHHAGHGESGKRRNLRPYGNSYWRRWVSYGYGLHPVDDTNGHQMWFRPWRGPRDERAWPDRLDRGTVWPWEGVYLDGVPKAWEETG